jgi:AcrR family transcriptional regulator
MKIFSRKGYASARMDEIAEEAELSVGILYWYYKGKIEIVLALMKMEIEPDIEKMQSLLVAPESCRARLWHFFGELQENNAVALALWVELYHLAAREARVRKQLLAYNAQYRTLAEKIIRQGIERGEVRANVDPQVAAFALQALFDGFLMNQTLNPKLPNFSERVRQSYAFFFDGVESKN